MKRFVTCFLEKAPDAKVISRDVSQGLPLLDEEWVEATFTNPSERSADQRRKLALSDVLVGELGAVDTLVIAAPILNFSVPAAPKAWIDLVARAQETFKYADLSACWRTKRRM